MLHCSKNFRLMLPQPHQLGADQLLAVAGPGQRQEFRLRHSGGEALELADRPRIVLLDAAAEHGALTVEEHDCRQHAGHPDAGDRLRPQARRSRPARG